MCVCMVVCMCMCLYMHACTCVYVYVLVHCACGCVFLWGNLVWGIWILSHTICKYFNLVSVFFTVHGST